MRRNRSRKGPLLAQRPLSPFYFRSRSELEARTEQEAAQHGDKVANELAALVAHKLSEIKLSETGA